MSGSANALTDTLPTLATTSDGSTQYVIPALVVGMTFHGIIPATNTGPATLTLTGFGTAPGAKPIVRRDGTPIQAGDLPGNAIISWRWDGTAYRVVGVVTSDIATTSVAAVSANKTTLAFPIGTSTWTCPAGIAKVDVYGRGAGGGGGGCTSGGGGYAAGGGGGGAYFIGTFAVVPGTAYTIVVGASGAQGSSAGSGGGVGGSTSFGSLATAPGGGGGGVANGSTTVGGGGAGGAAATVPSGVLAYGGSPGSGGQSVGGVGEGGAGGGSYGQGATNLAAIGLGGGIFGQFPGLGGNGGGGGAYPGGGGGNGELVIRY